MVLSSITEISLKLFFSTPTLHHGMEPEAFLHDVHDIDAHEILEKDDALNAALARLPGRKVIHTNGIREHAERILAVLGIAHHFKAIYDIRFNDYIPKPCQKTLASLIAVEGFTPARTLVVDDMADNLRVAKALGCKTVWITHERSGAWDYHIPTFHDLPTALENLEFRKALPFTILHHSPTTLFSNCTDYGMNVAGVSTTNYSSS